MSGSVEVQSKARRSYRAVVIPTDALLTFGILKLTSLIVAISNNRAKVSVAWSSGVGLERFEGRSVGEQANNVLACWGNLPLNGMGERRNLRGFSSKELW